MAPVDSQIAFVAMPVDISGRRAIMVDNAKKLHLALKILTILQEEDLSLQDSEDILKRTMAMLHAWHGSRERS